MIQDTAMKPMIVGRPETCPLTVIQAVLATTCCIPHADQRLESHAAQAAGVQVMSARETQARDTPAHDPRIAVIARVLGDHHNAPNLWLARRIIQELNDMDETDRDLTTWPAEWVDRATHQPGR